MKSESCILNTTSKQSKMTGRALNVEPELAGDDLNLLHVLFWALTVLNCHMGEMVLTTVEKNTMRMVFKEIRY